jgi:hypothetical protein
MTARTRLLWAGAVLALTASALAEPPGDKPAPIPERYAARLEAARLIGRDFRRTQALLRLAAEAAEDGEDEVVKRCLDALPDAITLPDAAAEAKTITDLIVRVAGAGREAEALAAAKKIPEDNFRRNQVLEEIAAGKFTGPAAFWRACENGRENADVIKTVSLPNAKDKDGETGLMKAAARGHVAVVKRLLAGENVEIWEVDKQGRTALMKAAENGQDAVVRLFLTYFTDKSYPKNDPLNIADAQGRTALMLAAAKGRSGVVRVLLDVRFDNSNNDKRFLTLSPRDGTPATFIVPFEPSLVDWLRKDDEGKTALDLAKAGKHAGVVDLLTKEAK